MEKSFEDYREELRVQALAVERYAADVRRFCEAAAPERLPSSEGIEAMRKSAANCENMSPVLFDRAEVFGRYVQELVWQHFRPLPSSADPAY